MPNAATCKLSLLTALERVVDEPLRAEGFVRRKGGLLFIRRLNVSKQEIAFVAEWNPRYQPGADANFVPMMRLKMPTISELAMRLVREDKMPLAGAPEIILNQPIDFTAPKEARMRWFATGVEGAVDACQSILEFLQRWTLPLLSELSQAEDLVRAYETNDIRITKQKHWNIFVIAAYRQLGDVEAAREVLADQFQRPGIQRRYAKLLETMNDPI